MFLTIVVSVYALLEKDKLLGFAHKLSSAILNEEACKKFEEYANYSNKI